MPSHSFACKLLHCAAHPTHKASAEEAQQDAGNGSITAQTFTFRELASATKNFRPEFLLGEEGFGRVYKGCLENNGQVKCGTSADQKPISWYTRMKIAYGTAQEDMFMQDLILLLISAGDANVQRPEKVPGAHRSNSARRVSIKRLEPSGSCRRDVSPRRGFGAPVNGRCSHDTKLSYDGIGQPSSRLCSSTHFAATRRKNGLMRPKQMNKEEW
ncbi:hypothetical protein BHE74_00004187 [Ensete ventricosum]|nr:hypothetical protein BHE74_00004187 [Ensete ventricosum]